MYSLEPLTAVSSPDGLSYGKLSGGRKLRRRTSAGSMPSSSATRSIARSMTYVASGRPAPRYASTNVVLV